MRHLRHILLAVSLSACPPRDLATMPIAVAPDVPPLAAPQARPRPSIVELPDSRVDLVDGGDTATRRAFFEQHRTPRRLALGSLDDWLNDVDTLGHGVAAEIVARLAAQEVG